MTDDIVSALNPLRLVVLAIPGAITCPELVLAVFKEKQYHQIHVKLT